MTRLEHSISGLTVGDHHSRCHISIGSRWQASTLDAEAATWQLLWHLHGVTEREFPGGLGGPALDDVGGLCTAAQRIADAVAQFDDLNRCALEGPTMTA